MKHHYDTITSDFTCKHCHHYVSTDPTLSGVHNRNHCPYCLWSRHLDLYEAGDRLSACKGTMRPIGLSIKRTKKKYGSQQGELMIIHQCMECGKTSINRIASDDIAGTILEVYESSLVSGSRLACQLEQHGIQALTAQDADLVNARLFGWKDRAPRLSFA